MSTPTDLDRFWRSLLGGRLLPPRMLTEMTTTVPAPQLGPGLAYGLGLMRIPLSCGGHAWGHAGDLLGVSNVTGQADAGRTATVYLTARTGPQAANRLRHTIDVALCVDGT